MKYNVTLQVVVNVRIEGIEAASQTQAIDSAEASVNIGHLIETVRVPREVKYVEYVGEIPSALVDEVGDDEFVNSHWYKGKGDAWLPFDEEDGK